LALRSHDPCWRPSSTAPSFARWNILTIEIHGHWRGIEEASIVKRRQVDHTA
jgi:hypothetical protein